MSGPHVPPGRRSGRRERRLGTSWARRSALAILCAAGVVAPASMSWGAAGAVGPGDWTQFQGNPSHAGVPASATLAPPLQRLWRFNQPGEPSGLSGAVIAGGVAIAVGQHAVYGVDATTGTLSWQVSRNGGQIVLPAVGQAGAKTVLVYTEGPKRSTAAVVGVDLATRAELWRRSLEGVSTSGVTIDGSNVLLGDENGRLYQFDLATGRPASWSPRSLGGGGVDAPPAAAGGEIFPVTRDRTSGDVRVFGINERTGRQDWDYAPRYAVGTSSAVTAAGSLVYFGLGNELQVHAISRTTGVSAWTARTRSSFWPLSGPAFAAGTLYVLSTSPTDSALYAFDGSSGKKRWDFEFQSAGFLGSPVVIGGTAYVGLEDGRVLGIDVRREVEVWEDHTGPGGIGPLAVSGDELIASKRGRRGGLIAFGPNPGGRLLDIPSPTTLKLGRNLAGFAIAFAGVLLVVFAAGRGARRLVGEDEAKPRPGTSSPEARGELDVAGEPPPGEGGS